MGSRNNAGRIPASALALMHAVQTPFGSEFGHGRSKVLAVVSGDIATEKPLAELRLNNQTPRWAEYLPENLEILDATLSDKENGSQIYRQAKSVLFNLGAVNPKLALVVKVNGSEVKIKAYRPRLSEWLIKGLARIEDQRLIAAGIMPGEDLEARLCYHNGEDFTLNQYSAMASVLEEIIIASEGGKEAILASPGSVLKKYVAAPAVANNVGADNADAASFGLDSPEGDQVPSLKALLRGYLTGRAKVPRLDRWEMLRVLGAVSQEVLAAYHSRNREQFMQQDGLYWAVRMHDFLRSFLRKRHILMRGRAAASTQQQKDPEDWDHIYSAQAFAAITGGKVTPLDDFFDLVTVFGNVPVTDPEIQQKAAPTGSFSEQSKNPSGIYVPGRFSYISAPSLKIRTAKELWIDYVVLFHFLTTTTSIYMSQKRLNTATNGNNGTTPFGLISTPSPNVLATFDPGSMRLIRTFVFFDPDAKQNKREAVSDRDVASIIIDDIRNGQFDSELKLPSGAAQKLLSVMASTSPHIPQEITDYSFAMRGFNELTVYLDFASSYFPPTNSASQLPRALRRLYKQNGVRVYTSQGLMQQQQNIDRVQKMHLVMSVLGIDPVPTSHREIRKLRDRFEANAAAAAKSYLQEYGENLRGFVGIDLSSDPTKEPEVVNGVLVRRYPTEEFYRSVLSAYCLEAFSPYAAGALPQAIAAKEHKPLLTLNGSSNGHLTLQLGPAVKGLMPRKSI